jgi:hypothetical protein
MNTKEIEALLDKYYEGMTTLEEETLLRDFFVEEIVPPHLAAHADLFRSFDELHKEELLDHAFEEKVLSSLTEPRVIQLYKNRNRLLYITNIAAGFLLLAGLFFTFRNDIVKNNPTNTFSNPNLAYAETQKALLILAGNFHIGMNKMSRLSAFDQGLEKCQNLRQFDNGITQAQKFSEFYKYQQLISNPDEK